MRIRKARKIYLMFGLILILTIVIFCLQSYSEALTRNGLKELYEINHREAAIEKIRFAQIIWPFLKLDKGYQDLLNQLAAIEQRSAVTIYLKSNSSAQDINALVSELKTIKGVREVKYISQEEALENYKDQNKADPILQELVTKDVLPQSIDIYLDDDGARDKVEKVAKSKTYVSEVLQSL